MRHIGIVASLSIGFSLVFAAPVLAAAPANDTFAGRVAIGALPFSASTDTSEATTDADDVEANAQCGAPATDASVWYALTAADDGNLIVDVSASDYSAGVIVATGTPGSFSIVTCGPGAIAFFASAGETYSILAFDDQTDGAGNGGNLEISVTTPPPPPVIEVSVDPVGQFDAKTGSATVHGTVSCTGVADFAALDVQLRQSVGRFVVSGFGSTDFACDGTTQPWSVEVLPDNGLFKGGRTASVTVAFACGPFDCGEASVERRIMLRH